MMLFDSIKVPLELICPISQDIMLDPVVAADGHTYDRKEIEQWLTNHNTSPNTNLPLKHKELIPNLHLKGQLSDFIDKNRSTYEKELIEAARKADIATIEYLLTLGISINAQAYDGWRAIHYACASGNLDFVKFLMAHQAKLEGTVKHDQYDEKFFVPQVMLTTQVSCLQAIDKAIDKIYKELLQGKETLFKDMQSDERLDIKQNMDVRLKLSKISSLISEYSSNYPCWIQSNEEKASTLLSRHYIVSYPSRWRTKCYEDEYHKYMSDIAHYHKAKDALSLEAQSFRLVVTPLLTADANLTKIREQTRTLFQSTMHFPLLLASHQESFDMLELFIQQGADINTKDDKGRTLLHWSVYHAEPTLAQWLIKHKADINMQDNEGNTALHLAGKLNIKWMVDLLLEEGANYKQINQAQLTAAKVAKEAKHHDLAKYIAYKGLELQHVTNKRLQETVSSQASQIESLQQQVAQLNQLVQQLLIGKNNYTQVSSQLSSSIFKQSTFLSEEESAKILSLQAKIQGFFVQKAYHDKQVLLKAKIENVEEQVYSKLRTKGQRTLITKLSDAIERNQLSEALRIIRETDSIIYDSLIQEESSSAKATTTPLCFTSL